MIIAATPFVPAGRAAERTQAVSTATTAGNAAEAGDGDAASDALAQLDDFVESAALARKAFAEDRLKHLKEQMTTLSLFNLAPGFLVGHTARMAKELESAAKDFASSFKTLSGLGQDSTENSTQDAPLPSAYLDVASQDKSGFLRPTTEDAETASSFADMALQLRGVVEMASDWSRDKAHDRRSADDARNATSRVVDLMARIQTPTAFTKLYW